MNKKITVLVISHLLCVVLGCCVGVILTKSHEPDAKNIDTTESIISESTNQAVETTEEILETVTSTVEETFTEETTEETEVPAAKESASQPPTAKPPATSPPTTQPPAATPPATQPPATQPPAGGSDEGFSGGRA